MAAVIAPHPRSTPAHRPAPTPRRPPLHVIEGGRQAARAYSRQARTARPVHPAVYRRRRLIAGLAVVALIAVSYLAVTGLGVVLGRGASAGPPAPASAVSSPVVGSSTSYVVQPGDTLWSIARHLHPSGDIRAVVDELAARAGSASLQAGQRLSLDGLTD